MRKLLALSLFALGLITSHSAFAATCSNCSGNELMYLNLNDLTALSPASVDPANDYLAVYSAVNKHTMKVPANSVQGSGPGTQLTADTTLTSSFCGKKLLLNKTAASLTATLPAATGSGCSMRLYVQTINTSNYVITKAGSDTIKGGLIFSSDNGSNAVIGFETTGASTITLNGTTQGGAAVADYVDLYDAVTGVWYLTGRVTESGSEATPFS